MIPHVLRALALLVLLAPPAGAMDLLPDEIQLGELEARLLVRSAARSVRVSTEPSVLAAPAHPDAEPGTFAPTPRVLEANATWRGLEGVLVVVLRRPAATLGVDVTVEDGAGTGVSLEWPPAGRDAPLGAWLVGVAIAVTVAIGRRRRGP